MRRSIALALLVALSACLLAACGGSEAQQSSTEQTASVPGGADPGDVQVIDEWAKALSDGDIEGAAGYFAIPSVAENGPSQIAIADPGDAKLFNSSLPCGATLVEATPENDFTVATFKLTERPGPGRCGTGADGEAQTAFKIADGKITEWRRVVDAGSQPAPGRSA